MHLGPEGMAKKLLDMFFDKRNIGKPFYLRRALKSIDCNLVKQKLPHKFSRAPQNITKHLKHWKASEFRTWLLYYSLPLLLNYLLPLYFHHYALLLCAIIFLFRKCYIDVAQQMLKDFCVLLPELYGESSCTMA